LRLRSTSHSLRTATGEIEASATDLSGRTLQQAVAIEQANEMIRQLATTLAENAKRLSSAGKLSKGLVQGASAGNTALQDAGVALETVAAGHASLGELAALFDDMAFQSNLLALKASVEAANSGNAGSGFGEVAVETRALAQRAAETAQQARHILDTSTSSIEVATGFVNRASQAVATISGSAGESAQTVEAVAKAGRNQCDALEQVIIVLREMHETIQHNAVLSEQTNSALTETNLQIEALDLVMQLFEAREEPQVALAG
jgi:methyl-accepting chemotaxis protein